MHVFSLYNLLSPMECWRSAGVCAPQFGSGSRFLAVMCNRVGNSVFIALLWAKCSLGILSCYIQSLKVVMDTVFWRFLDIALSKVIKSNVFLMVIAKGVTAK